MGEYCAPKIVFGPRNLSEVSRNAPLVFDGFIFVMLCHLKGASWEISQVHK